MARRLHGLSTEDYERVMEAALWTRHDAEQAARAQKIEAARFAASAAANAAPAGVAAGAAFAPPVLTGGEKVEFTDVHRLVITESGKVKAVPKRRGYGGSAAMIDWVNFTFSDSCMDDGTEFGGTDDRMIVQASLVMERIFGFGITEACARGRNFYKRSWMLGDRCGYICHGGQRNTMLVMVSGEGCSAAAHGWEKRLHDFLAYQTAGKSGGSTGRITRIDLAHDCYAGEYSVDRAKLDYEIGAYSIKGRHPDCEQRGNWHTPNGKGRSFYVGHRKNGKYLRVYEKGRQLGDCDSEWVRVEVELKSVDRVIPFDALLIPGEYLAASYPALDWISEEQKRITTTRKRAEISYESTKKWLKHQCGAALAVVREVEGSAVAAMELLVKVGKLPKRLNFASADGGPVPLHKRVQHPRRDFELEEIIRDALETVLPVGRMVGED